MPRKPLTPTQRQCSVARGGVGFQPHPLPRGERRVWGSAPRSCVRGTLRSKRGGAQSRRSGFEEADVRCGYEPEHGVSAKGNVAVPLA